MAHGVLSGRGRMGCILLLQTYRSQHCLSIWVNGFYLWLHYSFNSPSHLRLFSWESVDNLTHWQRDNHQHRKAPFWRRQTRGTSKCCLCRLCVQAQSQAQANDSLAIPHYFRLPQGSCDGLNEMSPYSSSFKYPVPS